MITSSLLRVGNRFQETSVWVGAWIGRRGRKPMLGAYRQVIIVSTQSSTQLRMSGREYRQFHSELFHLKDWGLLPWTVTSLYSLLALWMGRAWFMLPEKVLKNRVMGVYTEKRSAGRGCWGPGNMGREAWALYSSLAPRACMMLWTRESCLALHTGHRENDKKKKKKGKDNHLNDSSLRDLMEYEINSKDWITCPFCFDIRGR